MNLNKFKFSDIQKEEIIIDILKKQNILKRSEILNIVKELNEKFNIDFNIFRYTVVNK